MDGKHICAGTQERGRQTQGEPLQLHSFGIPMSSHRLAAPMRIIRSITPGHQTAVEVGQEAVIVADAQKERTVRIGIGHLEGLPHVNARVLPLHRRRYIGRDVGFVVGTVVVAQTGGRLRPSPIVEARHPPVSIFRIIHRHLPANIGPFRDEELHHHHFHGGLRGLPFFIGGPDEQLVARRSPNAVRIGE